MSDIDRIEAPDNPSVKVTKQAWRALKGASEAYGVNMGELASRSICDLLHEFVVREEPHEDQLELLEWLENQ